MSKCEVLKAMNTLVRSLNNEEAYLRVWIMFVPNEASDDDLKDICENEELFGEVAEVFKRIMQFYTKDGFYIEKKLY